MEQTASTEWKSEYLNISKNEFKALILMDKEKTRYDFVYFTLNALYQIGMVIVMILKINLNVKFAQFL